uniref:Solute carrier family 9 member 2 n=1 Tax=Cyprinus carpio TaxID=7962 RepID=A0A8C1UUE0_CYPCA
MVWVPESCLLISVGLIVGVLTSNAFFLLPPIVLDSGYFMPTRPFFENFGTVLWFAVVGTLWNTTGIGISLFAICQIEAFGVQDINLQENLHFASIISAVEPVAVLTVFEDISNREQLYIVHILCHIFVLFYNLLNHVAVMEVVEAGEVFLHIGLFFVMGFEGMLFGLLFGFVAAFTTCFTGKVREIKPLMIFLSSYLAYLIAELFAISSIMYYVEEDVSQHSCTTIRHVIKIVGSVSEALIFFFLGVVTITTELGLNLLYSAVCSAMERILVLTEIINPFRTIPFNFKDQFGLAYDSICCKKLFITGTFRYLLTANESFLGVFVCKLTKNSKFIKFNNRRIHKILIHDNCSESSIVALYKKLELQNAMEILVKMSGEISAAPSLISLQHCYFLSLTLSLLFYHQNAAKMSQKLFYLPMYTTLLSESEIDYVSNRPMFRHPQRLSSKVLMPVRPLDTLIHTVNTVDEQNEEQRGYGMTHLGSNISHSGHQTSRLPYGSSGNYSDEDRECEEQHSRLSLHAWVQEPQNNSDVQHPLMGRPHWLPHKPQDQ